LLRRRGLLLRTGLWMSLLLLPVRLRVTERRSPTTMRLLPGRPRPTGPVMSTLPLLDRLLSVIQAVTITLLLRVRPHLTPNTTWDTLHHLQARRQPRPSPSMTGLSTLLLLYVTR
jgi:hypothetical protein